MKLTQHMRSQLPTLLFLTTVIFLSASVYYTNLTCKRPESSVTSRHLAISPPSPTLALAMNSIRIIYMNNTVKDIQKSDTQTQISPTKSSKPVEDESGKLFIAVKTENLKYRLGNQMFIYAAMLGIARAQHREAFIESGKTLGQTFAVSHVNSRVNVTGWQVKAVKNYATFDPEVFHLPKTNISLQGLFQSWKYFLHIQDEIRREFTFHPHIRKKSEAFYKNLLKDCQNCTFVGVHVRRGDFLTAKNKGEGFVTASISYFIKAFNLIRSILTNQIVFIVGSDDLDWCRVNLNMTDVIVLSPDVQTVHLAILSNTTHSVISTGTYGWWAAWLANGITVYYNRYPIAGSKIDRGFNKADYYPPTWIGIGD